MKKQIGMLHSDTSLFVEKYTLFLVFNRRQNKVI